MFIERLLSPVTILATMIFFTSMLIFLSDKSRQHKAFDFRSLFTFMLLWIGTLIFESSFETKAYVTSLAISLIVVRILVTRERKRRASGH